MYSQRPIVKPVSKIDNFLDSIKGKYEDEKKVDPIFQDREFTVPEFSDMGLTYTDLELYEAMSAENQDRGLIGARSTSKDDLIKQYENINPPIYKDWINHENRLYQGKQPRSTGIRNQVDLIRDSNSNYMKSRNIYSRMF